MESRVEKAAERKMCGYNCAQAVALSLIHISIIIAALLSISFFGITYILGLRYIFPYTCAVLRILLMTVYISGHHRLYCHLCL